MIEENVIPKDIKSLLEELDRSPAFAMSRGGRELFHTNFLAFILEQVTNDINEETYPQIIKKHLLEKFYGEKSAPKNVLVLREKLNFDLFIIPIDGVDGLTDQPEFGKTNIIKQCEKTIEIVVIEAKLKSIPTTDQLTKYSDKLNNKITIELIDDENSAKLVINKGDETIELDNGLTYDAKRKITFKFNDIKYKCILLAPEAFKLTAQNWTFLPWSNLVEISCTEKFKKDDLMSVFIKDYLDSTRHTIVLIDKAIALFNEKIKKNETLDGIINFCTHDAFKKRRIHDLVGKVFYELLAKHIHEELKVHEQLKDKNELIYKAFFTNSTPGLQLEFVLKGDKNETGIGVQLQGKDYRHYVRRNFTDESEGNTLLEVANKYRDWLSKDGNKGKIQKKQEKSSEEQFKKFDENRFLYLSRDVKELTVKKLICAFNRSLIDGNDTTSQENTAFKVFEDLKPKDDQNHSSTKSST